ncbi:MAG: AAA family ATPase [Bacteroidia bacterium]
MLSLSDICPVLPDTRFDWEKTDSEFTCISQLRGVPQDQEWHAEGDVWVHTRMVAEALAGLAEWQEMPREVRENIFLSALFHDVGKYFCTTTDNGRIIAPHHARRGEFIVRELLYKGLPLHLPFHRRETVCKLVRLHGVPLWSLNEASLIRASMTTNLKHLALLAGADVLGRVCPDQKQLLEKVSFFRLFAQEQNCYESPYPFASPHSKFVWFHRKGNAPAYEPFDDTWGEVILMSGLPGAGKDTWIQNHGNGLPVVSLDDIRVKMKIKPTETQGAVVQAGKEMARQWLRKKQPFIWNATNITSHTRSGLISLFTDYKARVKIVYAEAGYSQLMHRNSQREAALPPEVIEKMISKLEIPAPEEAHEVVYSLL